METPMAATQESAAILYNSLTSDQLITLLIARSLSLVGSHEEWAIRLAEDDITNQEHMEGVHSSLPVDDHVVPGSINVVLSSIAPMANTIIVSNSTSPAESATTT
ncbi:hypothetical protein Q9L58_005846 [Maublancomyces gigas]|uniref:Uncharacterized protein n=1 Tax=Discina gigas TaxID=1032678 RepID=A0ABR3GHD4_9PEZI